MAGRWASSTTLLGFVGVLIFFLAAMQTVEATVKRGHFKSKSLYVPRQEKSIAEVAFSDHRPLRDTVPAGKILDMHVHVAGIGAGGSGCFISRDIQESLKFGMYMHSFSVSVQELRDSGDALVFSRLAQRMHTSERIGTVVVLALDGVIHDGKLDSMATQIYVPGDFVARETKKRPGMLYGASVNPYRSNALQKLRQAALDGAVLVKWIPSIMQIDPADTSLTRFYQEMVRLHLPLLTHTGNEHAFSKAIDSLCDPRRLKLPLRLGVTIIAAHAGVPGRSDGVSYSQMLKDMFRVYPHLYADISSLTQINKLGSLQTLLADSLTRSRLIYGSDYPLNFTRLVSPLYHSYTLGILKATRLKAMPDHWDRDIALKEALGVPASVFRRSAILLLPVTTSPAALENKSPKQPTKERISLKPARKIQNR